MLINVREVEVFPSIVHHPATVEIERERWEQLEALAREAQGFIAALYGPEDYIDNETWAEPILRLLKKLGLPVQVYLHYPDPSAPWRSIVVKE